MVLTLVVKTSVFRMNLDSSEDEQYHSNVVTTRTGNQEKTSTQMHASVSVSHHLVHNKIDIISGLQQDFASYFRVNCRNLSTEHPEIITILSVSSSPH